MFSNVLGPLPRENSLSLELFIAVPIGSSGLEASVVPVQNKYIIR